MKSAVIYYSHYGNTATVMHEISRSLKAFGEVEMLSIEYAPKNKGLLERVIYRLFPTLVNIAKIKTDLKEYDFICFGIPVWGGRPSSPVIRYLKLCKNIKDKKLLCVYVYGVEASAEICARFVEKMLKAKGYLHKPANLLISWDHVHNEEFLHKTITEAVKATVKSL